MEPRSHSYTAVLPPEPTPSVTPDQLNREIRHTLRLTGRTQGEAANAIGVSLRSLNRKLSGHGPLLVEELLGLAAFLGVPADELVHRATQQVPR